MTINSKIALSLAGLYSTAWTLSLTGLLLGFNSKIFPQTAVAQPLIPNSQQILPPLPLPVPPAPATPEPQ
ncbi:MAG: hypothetical protein HC942_14965, partial [Microcoleus sp. SU_5_6]|nr:hypothetical protein [Microcoleus sp. SU_5_6]